jgi:DNA ligase (NAD+)
MIDRLKAAGVTMRTVERGGAETGPFTGSTVVITGSIPGYTRDEIKMMLLRQGARVSDSVSKKTDIVIHGADPGSKLDKARALGIRLVDADEFRRLAGGTEP